MKVGVIGLGYVGLATLASLLSHGQEVVGYDNDKDKVLMLQNGVDPLGEPKIMQTINKYKKNVTLTDSAEQLRKLEVIFVCVNTPEGENGQADLTALHAAIDQAILYASIDTLFIIKSTIPVGESRKILKYINEKRPVAGLKVAFSPEFLRQGNAFQDANKPDRLVFGVDDEESKGLIESLYGNFKTPILFVNYETAELSKYASNNFLATKISFINEIANIASATGADIIEIKEILNYDARMGKGYMDAGVGYGGGCLVKDTKALINQADALNVEVPLIKATVEQNEKQKFVLLNELKRLFPNPRRLKEQKVLVVGYSFKGNSGDLRDSIALANIRGFSGLVKEVSLYDPLVSEKDREAVGYPIETSLSDGIKNASVIMIFTERYEINDLPNDAFNGKMVLDGRNILETDKAKQCAYYFSIGRNI